MRLKSSSSPPLSRNHTVCETCGMCSMLSRYRGANNASTENTMFPSTPTHTRMHHSLKYGLSRRYSMAESSGSGLLHKSLSRSPASERLEVFDQRAFLFFVEVGPV